MKIKTKMGNIAADYIDCGSSSPLLIIAHGRGGHRNTGSKKIAEYLQGYGISTLRIDLYGYGESDGKFEDITITTAKETILGVYAYAKSKLKYSKLFLFGTSYGGSGILGALEVINPAAISGCLLRCTILNYLKKTMREFTQQELNTWKLKGFIDDYEGKLKYGFVEDMKNYTQLNFDKLSQFKILYFYAGKDTKVLKEEVDEVKTKLLASFDVITYPNSVHGIDIKEDFDDMLVRTKDFIINN